MPVQIISRALSAILVNRISTFVKIFLKVQRLEYCQKRGKEYIARNDLHCPGIAVGEIALEISVEDWLSIQE